MTSLDFAPYETTINARNRALKYLLNYLSSNSPFYINHFRNHNIDISKIREIKDLVAIPVVTKNELQQNNPDFLCVPQKAIIEYCTTSGTMGNPVTIALTEHDLQRLARNELQSFKCAGLSSDDIIVLMLSLDRQFMAGIAYYLGARELGAGIIRGGPGNFSMQIDLINKTNPTILIAVPSFIVGLVTYARENNFNLNNSSVKKIICIGENVRNDDFTLNGLGRRITDYWNVLLYSTYASTEQQTAFTECHAGKGGHHQPELLIFEILDEFGNQLPAGVYGELVISTLGVEGMPLLRYNTGDICAYMDEKCACGRTSVRISPIAGRKQQMIKYKGTTIYPQTIINLLNSLEGIQDYVINLFKNELGTDDLTISIAISPSATITESEIRQSLQSALRIVPEINYLNISDVQKLQIVEGKRKIYKLVDFRE